VWTGISWLKLGTSCGLFVNVVMNIRVPYYVRNFLTSWGTVSFSRSYVLCRVSWLVGLSDVFMGEDTKLNDQSVSPKGLSVAVWGWHQGPVVRALEYHMFTEHTEILYIWSLWQCHFWGFTPVATHKTVICSNYFGQELLRYRREKVLDMSHI